MIDILLQNFQKGLNSEAAKVMKKLLTSATTRYVSVNIRENYIEVRSAGGDYLKDLSKIKLTLLRYVRAMAIAADPEAEKQEYGKKVYKFLSNMIPQAEDTIKYFSQYSAGSLPKVALKSFVHNIRSKREDDKIPQIITANTPQEGKYAYLIKFRTPAGTTKTLKMFADGQSSAKDKGQKFLVTHLPGEHTIISIEPDLEDPTNKLQS